MNNDDEYDDCHGCLGTVLTNLNSMGVHAGTVVAFSSEDSTKHTAALD